MRTGRIRGAAAALTVLVCAAGPLATPGEAQAAGPRTLEQVRAEVDGLYRQAEAATGAYDAATQQVDQQQKDLVTLARAVVATQAQLDALTERAGALTRAQYQSGSAALPLAAQLLLSPDPQSFLDDAGVITNSQQAVVTALAQLRTTENELEEYANAATAGWGNLVAEQGKQAAAKTTIEARLARAKALLGSLESQQRAQLQQMDDEAAYRSQMSWLSSSTGSRLGATSGTADAPGARAVRFATAQIGKPYAWGAQGPSAYDCSGLTEMAWAAAGVMIPRTSQEQWAQLPHVPLDELRPGDLIVYYSDASHVALYIGGGAVIQAPRPGHMIDIAGAGSMPILGAVRPG
ncbi:NlpC/P60 family protein [Streptomyces sp. RB6PN25]|uniref:NlpC/P60 family protein n=1 Tax=Streptomyces humicola TaxID=2953240 RepID=A0ABT1Q3Y7_9ACTN|nr:C40 family peptidase [Streptomyces humicola]MCQ4084634.1 NlpC/P60 family protein [Streptomyces humicola]